METLKRYLTKYENDNHTNIIIITDKFWKKRLVPKIKYYVIDIDDKDSFMGRYSLIQTKSKYKDIDIILHTDGGDAYNCEMIASLMLEHAKHHNVRTHVPEYAFSAGTVIALSGKLHMNAYSFLGPTEPQICVRKDEYISSETVIKLCGKRKIHDIYDTNIALKCIESNLEYEENMIFMSGLLDKTQPLATCYIKDMLYRGSIPHAKGIMTKTLTDNGIIIYALEKSINNVFMKFRTYKDNYE